MKFENLRFFAEPSPQKTHYTFGSPLSERRDWTTPVVLESLLGRIGIVIEMTNQTKQSLNEVIGQLDANSPAGQYLSELRDRVIASHSDRNQWPSVDEFKRQLSRELQSVKNQKPSETQSSSTLVMA